MTVHRMRRADGSVSVRIPLKTSNPNNGAMGNTRTAAIIKSRIRKEQRGIVCMAMQGAKPLPDLPVDVLVVRIAPSSGLDPHDGLGAALKSVIDGTADALGLSNDRDERVTWRLGQRRGARGEYAVEVLITAMAS